MSPRSHSDSPLRRKTKYEREDSETVVYKHQPRQPAYVPMAPEPALSPEKKSYFSQTEVT